MKKYNLIDYKGKFDIIMDKGLEDYMDFIIGEISHEEALAQVARRKESADYFGIPAYIGSNEELRAAFDKCANFVS